MFIARDLEQLAQAGDTLRATARGLALVPTMGALHDGHLALVDAARRDGSAVAVSIFVNPLQFNAAADLARYPVDHARDLALLEAAGCDLVWLPSAEIMYPAGHCTVVDVGGPAHGLEGMFRPGHFRGVATVVTMLLGQVRPNTVWFGEKDWQQLQVVRRLATDLSLGSSVRAIPTVRERDGLAMSSRNRFLTAAERAVAPILYMSLCEIAASIAAGDRPAAVIAAATVRLAERGLETEYLALVDGASLAALDHATDDARLIAAVKIGSVRILDNVPVTLDRNVGNAAFGN